MEEGGQEEKAILPQANKAAFPEAWEHGSFQLQMAGCPGPICAFSSTQ